MIRPLRRSIEVFLLVAAWMACGWLLRLGANAYLLVGVPLTILFQRIVRRQPLRGLWVREAPPFHLGRNGIALAVALSAMPLLGSAGAAFERDVVGCLFYLCSVGGALGAAYALRHFRREHLRPLALCLLITTTLDAIQWSLFLGLGLVEVPPAEGGVPGRVLVGVISLIEYMAVVFAMEEVSFRMLDSHLHEASGRPGILSAVGISAAWGLWHLPIGEEVTWLTVGALLYIHLPYGVCLSLFWRRTGNLVIPGLCHALGDAFRNAMMASG
jgi:membrane protease YdiL (CAAX protease family)